MDESIELLRNIFAQVDGARMPYEQPFYPPRQVWGALPPKKVLGFWRQRASAGTGHNSRLYLHFPFCEKICHFCGFNAVKMNSAAQVERYLKALSKEMRLVAGQVRGMRFNQFCMGGGTPSLLTPAQFKELFAEIFSLFDFDKNAKDYGIEVECHPDSLTFEKIKAMAAHKVTDEEAIRFVAELFGDTERPLDDNKGIPAVCKVLGLYAGNGKGSDMASAKGTAYGLLNACSEYVDWHVGKSQDRRLESAWMYGGSNLKQQAFDMAYNLAAA